MSVVWRKPEGRGYIRVLRNKAGRGAHLFNTGRVLIECRMQLHSVGEKAQGLKVYVFANHTVPGMVGEDTARKRSFSVKEVTEQVEVFL